MRLLVSVRSAAEARAALSGGADIIDAKEPSLGSLGAVGPLALREIAGAVPRLVPLSVALGDLASPVEVARAVEEVDRGVGARDELYVKLGLAGIPRAADAIRLLSAGVAAARRTGSARVIIVAYADHNVAGSPRAQEVVEVAGRAGADGVLLDTYGKDGRDLYHYLEPEILRAWVLAARRATRLVALAGSLGEERVRRVATIPVDVVGVRGAACAGGREGTVVEAKVRVLKAAVAASVRCCQLIV